jgi:hypothetical protein
MQLRVTAVVLRAGTVCSLILRAQNVRSTVLIVDGAHGVENAIIGSGFRNRFSVASEPAARNKIENLYPYDFNVFLDIPLLNNDRRLP